MKKFLFFAGVVGLALTSCAKNELDLPEVNNEITFQVANYAAVPQSKSYSEMEEGAFLAYAWYNNGQTTEQTMDALLVTKQAGVWSPSRPHYWPMTGTMDFIGTFPKGYQRSEANYGNRPAVTENTITWTDHVFNDPKGTTDQDIRYTDKAVGYNQNNSAEKNAQVNGITGYGFKGVPMLFHHAAAKVSIVTRLGRDNYQAYITSDNEGANSSDALGRYHWQVEVKKVTLNNHYNKGSLALTLAQQEEGNPLVGWTLPEDKLWTVSADKSVVSAEFKNVTYLDKKEENHLHSYYGPLTSGAIGRLEVTKPEDEPAEADKEPVEYIVMPQALAPGQQTITVEYTLYQQYDPSGDTVIEGDTDHIDQGSKTFTKTFDLYTEALPSWQMNKHITYVIEFWPGGHNPGKWPNGDDPNLLEDTHAIYFAPVVENWETEGTDEEFEITPTLPETPADAETPVK